MAPSPPLIWSLTHNLNKAIDIKLDQEIEDDLTQTSHKFRGAIQKFLKNKKKATRQPRSPPKMVTKTPDISQRVNMSLNPTGDGTSLFGSPPKDTVPTPLDRSLNDQNTTIQRLRTVSPLTTPKQTPNLLETVQDLSKYSRQGTSFPTT